MEPVGGRVPPDARQVGDRQGHQEAGQGEQRHGPPGRRGVEPKVVRNVLEEGGLECIHHLEEAVRRDRHRYADNRGQKEEAVGTPGF